MNFHHKRMRKKQRVKKGVGEVDIIEYHESQQLEKCVDDW